MGSSLPMLAGMLSTTLFAASTLPMVVKAVRTRDLESYSLGNLALSNVGNVVHSVYVFSLPAGPIWALHGFYVVTAALMLVWYLRHAGSSPVRGAAESVGADNSVAPADPPTQPTDPALQRSTDATPQPWTSRAESLLRRPELAVHPTGSIHGMRRDTRYGVDHAGGAAEARRGRRVVSA